MGVPTWRVWVTSRHKHSSGNLDSHALGWREKEVRGKNTRPLQPSAAYMMRQITTRFSDLASPGKVLKAWIPGFSPGGSHSAGQGWWSGICLGRKHPEERFCVNVFETNGLGHLGDSVESEKSKRRSTDLCRTQHQGESLEKEEPVKEWWGRPLGKQQREMSEKEPFTPLLYYESLLHYHFSQYYFLKDKNVPFL